MWWARNVQPLCATLEDRLLVRFLGEEDRDVEGDDEEDDGPLRPPPAFGVGDEAADEGPTDGSKSWYGVVYAHCYRSVAAGGVVDDGCRCVANRWGGEEAGEEAAYRQRYDVLREAGAEGEEGEDWRRGQEDNFPS